MCLALTSFLRLFPPKLLRRLEHGPQIQANTIDGGVHILRGRHPIHCDRLLPTMGSGFQQLRNAFFAAKIEYPIFDAVTTGGIM